MKRIPVDRWVKRPELVMDSRLARKRIAALYVPCSEDMQKKSGVSGWKGPGTTSQGAGGWAETTVLSPPGALSLNFASAVFGFGPSVAMVYNKSGDVYSFSGNTCKFTFADTHVCDNGQTQSFLVSVDGEIRGADIDFKYTIELFCGEVVTCVENGRLTGPRTSSSAALPGGYWFPGEQTWTVECCRSRHVVKETISVWGELSLSGEDT